MSFLCKCGHPKSHHTKETNGECVGDKDICNCKVFRDLRDPDQPAPPTLMLYRSRPNRFQGAGGYWFLRVSRGLTYKDVPITTGMAETLRSMGVEVGPDGGGY